VEKRPWQHVGSKLQIVPMSRERVRYSVRRLSLPLLQSLAKIKQGANIDLRGEIVGCRLDLIDWSTWSTQGVGISLLPHLPTRLLQPALSQANGVQLYTLASYRRRTSAVPLPLKSVIWFVDQGWFGSKRFRRPLTLTIDWASHKRSVTSSTGSARQGDQSLSCAEAFAGFT
jgi:hypothetical protein